MRSFGIIRIGIKLLINDRAKFSALLLGITFAVFLMLEITALFVGILNRAYSTVTNVGASMWIMDPAVNTPTSSIPLPDYLLDAVRSIDGVRSAVPLFIGGGLIRLPDGTYQAVNVVGLDDTSLFGRPSLERGAIRDIYADNAFFAVDDSEFPKLGHPHIGSTFELNDHRGVVVGVARVAANGLNGVPTLYTTYSRAVEYLPTTRFTISYVLVEPRGPADIAAIKRRVHDLGYVALTSAEFDHQITQYYIYQTGVGTNILLMTVVSFLIGLSISGQTFYSFILENLEKFGALKAIGARGRDLVLMILCMAGLTALIGYGFGVGLVTMMITLAKQRLPSYASMLTPGNLSLAFAMVVVIAVIASYLGVRRVLRIEPFDIFRG